MGVTHILPNSHRLGKLPINQHPDPASLRKFNVFVFDPGIDPSCEGV